MTCGLVAAALVVAATGALATAPHGPYAAVADDCVACHRVHVGKNRSILSRPASQSTVCFTCHDGSGANANVSAQYADPAVPANDSGSREYYRHDALNTSGHLQARADEFGGVSERHSECADCHNAHLARATGATETAGGWTASGRLAAISGVSVTNGAAGTIPSYVFRDGVTSPIVGEYQLCFKCHSGFTQLPSNAGFEPSQYQLDKAMEFNPNNPSYHPVEAPGKNATAKMADSLAAPSPYKLWNFTTSSTIRCANCHASGDRYSQTSPPAPGADLPSHTSQYRGILLRNYRDRLLKGSTEAYAPADFALCLLCHGEAPFANETATATNFPLHGLHVANLEGIGAGGTDIDTPGAGQGNALCAECHFRLHSTTFSDGSQTLDGSRLVNFAPNVLPYAGTRSWTGGGSCTLTCHGTTHDNSPY